MKTSFLTVTSAIIFNLLLFTSCSKSDDSGSDKENPTSTAINSIASLKQAFDTGNITHVAYKNSDRELVSHPIIKMELFEQGDNVSDLPHIKITSKTDKGISKKSRLSLEEDPNAKIVNGARISSWAFTTTRINGAEIADFKPFVFIIEAEFTSSSLNLLDQKLDINFTKQ